MADLWQACKGPARIGPIHGELMRIVESQEQIATTSLVDDLAEQALLEEMLESAKPPRRSGTEHLHYLLATPFRYPPLRHGSRFGRRHEPSLLYASRRESTVLAEAAYYRLVFWHAMETPPPGGRLLTQHTLFRANYRTPNGIRLHLPPFSDHAAVLTHPTDYGATQALGTAMREAGVAAFEYLSARDPEHGINLGLFAPQALASRGPLRSANWLCELRAERVSFASGGQVVEFDAQMFFVDGALPRPAL